MNDPTFPWEDDSQLLGNIQQEISLPVSLTGITLESMYRALAVGDRILSGLIESIKLFHCLVSLTEVAL